MSSKTARGRDVDQMPSVAGDLLLAQRPFERALEGVRSRRLRHEIPCARTDRRDGRVERAARRHHDDGDVLPAMGDFRAKLDARRTPEVHVCENDGVVVLAQCFEPGFRARLRDRLESTSSEGHLDEAAEIRIVVHDEHAIHPDEDNPSAGTCTAPSLLPELRTDREVRVG